MIHFTKNEAVCQIEFDLVVSGQFGFHFLIICFVLQTFFCILCEVEHHHIAAEFSQFLSDLSMEQKEGGPLSDPGEADEEEKEKRGSDGESGNLKGAPNFCAVKQND